MYCIDEILSNPAPRGRAQRHRLKAVLRMQRQRKNSSKILGREGIEDGPENDSLHVFKKEKLMRSIAAALLWIACLSMMPCEAKAHGANAQKSKKTYVDPRDIRVSKEGIFVLEKGHLVPVETLSRDKGGIFVKKEWKRECRNCERKYDWSRHTHCPFCGYPNTYAE